MHVSGLSTRLMQTCVASDIYLCIYICIYIYIYIYNYIYIIYILSIYMDRYDR